MRTCPSPAIPIFTKDIGVQLIRPQRHAQFADALFRGSPRHNVASPRKAILCRPTFLRIPMTRCPRVNVGCNGFATLSSTKTDLFIEEEARLSTIVTLA